MFTVPLLLKGQIFYRYIAENTTGDQGAQYDDITNFFRAPIFPTLLEISKVLVI
jgi:hypothetical protein